MMRRRKATKEMTSGDALEGGVFVACESSSRKWWPVCITCIDRPHRSYSIQVRPSSPMHLSSRTLQYECSGFAASDMSLLRHNHLTMPEHIPWTLNQALQLLLQLPMAKVMGRPYKRGWWRLPHSEIL